MAFLVSTAETQFLLMNKRNLEFEEILVTNDYNNVTQALSLVAEKATNSDGSTIDLSNNPAYLNLQAKQQYTDSRKLSIESQLKIINEEVKGLQKSSDTNIKQDTAFLNISG